jgi:AbiV
MAVTDEAVWAVAKNASRHLVEANQHYTGKRFASAVASAVYAIEETGKLSFLATGSESVTSKKHAAHTLSFFALLKVAANWNWTWEWAQILRNGLSPDAALTEQQQRTMAEHPEYAELVGRLQMGKLSTLEERTQAFAHAMVAKEERDGTAKQWKPMFEKGLQQDRLRATYVDISESGFSSPEATNPDRASSLCWLGFAMLCLILTITIYTRPSLLSYRAELEHMFPDDLIGTADFVRFVTAFQGSRATSSDVTPPPATASAG